MARAAIEIPDDYLGGLRRCADTEKGDLSSFVIQAMLENYEAAKEDRRPMCGDTGVPRWYVEARERPAHRRRPDRPRGGAQAGDGRMPRIPCRCGLIACIRCGGPIITTMSASTRRRSNMPSIRTRIGYDLTTVHKGDCRIGLSNAVPGRRHCWHKAVFLDTLIGFGKRGLACQPAIVGMGLGGRRTQPWSSASRRPACGWSAAAIPIRDDRRAGERVQGTGQLDRHGRHGFHGHLDGRRLPHRGRLLPHRRHADERPHVLPVVAPLRPTHQRRRKSRIPHRSEMVHRLFIAEPASNGTTMISWQRSETMTGSLKNRRSAVAGERRTTLRELRNRIVVYCHGRVFTSVARASTSGRSRRAAGMPASN